MYISDLLHVGVENAVPLKHLEMITGLSNRIIRRMIEKERRNGTPICADNLNGYYLPANEEEKNRFVRSQYSRAKEIITTANAIANAKI